MSLDPLSDASLTIQLHAYAAIAALVIGLVQFAATKGTIPHRTLGWIWVLLIVFIAISSFDIQELRVVGAWSPIHLLSIFTLAMVVLGVMHARAHRVTAHRNTMVGIFFGALILAGAFTFVPGRIMHAVLFGE